MAENWAEAYYRILGEVERDMPDADEFDQYEEYERRVEVWKGENLTAEREPDDALPENPNQDNECRATKRDAEGYPWRCSAPWVGSPHEHVWTPDR